MSSDEKVVEIQSHDYWFKIVEFLQQNWALIDKTKSGCTVFFFGDTSGVFDSLRFSTVTEAENALRHNGFRRYAEEGDAQAFIHVPQPPFREEEHQNGKIYSSGRFWN